MPERIVNRSPMFYGPGPLARRPTGLGARPPLQGLVICAAQGLAVAIATGMAYNVFIGNPGVRKIEEYYQANPPK